MYFGKSGPVRSGKMVSFLLVMFERGYLWWEHVVFRTNHGCKFMVGTGTFDCTG